MEPLIQQALAERPAAEWIDLLIAAGVPCGRINTAADALAAPQTEAMDMVVEIPHPGIGSYRSLGIPLDFPPRRRGSPTGADARRAYR